MARGLLSAVGGALTGFGTGMAQQAEQDGKAKREERLAELQHGYRMQEQTTQNEFTTKRDATQNQYQTERDIRQNDFQTQRDETQHGYRIGEIGAQGSVSQANTRLSSDLQSRRDEQQRAWDRDRLGIVDRQQQDRDERQSRLQAEREGTWEPASDPTTGQRYLRNSRTGDVKAYPRAEAQFGGSADAKDVWKLTVDAYTTKKPGGQEETNWLGVYKDLADRPALQSCAYNLAKEQATQQATKEAGARSGWTGKGYDGMSAEEWIAKRADELAPPPRRSAPAPAAPAPQASSAPAPSSNPTSGKAAAPKGAPKAGDVVSGYRFRGGNPSDPKAWEEVDGE